jgi:TRAP-type C4-dicarboxylate transport system substrate-binding protein
MRRLLLALLLLLPVPARAEIVIKLATLAPEGTTWYRGVRAIADEWARISNGEVVVKIYAGGVAGNESAMVRKMRIGQLHGGAVTNVGIADIETSPLVTQTPLLIRDYPELDAVMAAMGPDFEKRVLDRGFVVLNWGEAGWVHMFTKEPMLTPADAGKFKTFAYEGDPAAVDVFKQLGFKPVVLASTDVLPSLQSGLIDGFPSTPLGALSLQWFALSKNMLDVPWAPLVGATVLTSEAWNSIPEQYRVPFLAAARKAGGDIRDEVRRQDGKAVEVMKKYGLVVHPVDASTKAAWQKLGESSWALVRGKLVPEDVFDRAKQVLTAKRSGK